MNTPSPWCFAVDGYGRRPPARSRISFAPALALLALAATLVSGEAAADGPYALSVTVTGNGTVLKEPDLPDYPAGSTVQLTAVPGPNWVFAGWSGSVSGTLNPVTVSMDEDRVVTATFVLPILTPAPAIFPNYSLVLPPAWGDYDNDGFPDLPLYHNDGDGTFSEIPGFRSILNEGNYHGASWCDYDRDGDVDLVVLPYEGEELVEGAVGGGPHRTGLTAVLPGKARLFRNDGGTFTDVAPALGMDKVGFAETAVWADFDADGWPDLYEPFYTYLPPHKSFFFHNNGDGTFTEQATLRGVDLAGVPEALKPEGAHAADIDDDGDLDLYCASHLFLNDGNGYFTDVHSAAGLPQQFDEGSMFVDYDNDGDLDLSLRIISRSRLYRNDGLTFVDVTDSAGLLVPGFNWGDSWADVDNDGDLDLYIARPNNQTAHLMINQGDGTFLRDESFNPFDSSGLSAWADYDHDGDLDLHVEAYDRHMFENTRDRQPGFAGSYLRVMVLGAHGHQTQHGATVRLRRLDGPPSVQTRVVDGGSGYLTQSEYVVHFGVDPAGTYALEVSFPSRPDARAIVGPAQVPWLGALVPASLNGQQITIFRDGRARIGDWAITASAGGHGEISWPGTVTVPSTVSRRYVITPEPGYLVADVLVDGVSVGAVHQYTFACVTGDHTIAASFEPARYTLAMNVSGGGHVLKDPDLPQYSYGSSVTLTAVPDPGYTFVAWGEDLSATTSPITLTMTDDLLVMATFGIPVLEEAAVSYPSYGVGGLPPAFGDYDQDGDLDQPLYRNEGDGSVGEIPGFRELLARGNFHGGAWCDYDQDGDQDLWIQPYAAGSGTHALLLRNAGDGTFESVAGSLGMEVTGLGGTPTWADFDGDGRPDLFAPFNTDAAPQRSYLWRNQGNGTFAEVAGPSGAELRDEGTGVHAEGTAAGDYDDDGDVDVYCAGRLLRNDGAGVFADVRAAAGLPLVQDGAAQWVDYDRDGDLDLSLRSNAGPRLFRNDSGQFTEVSGPAGLAGGGAAWGDNWADVDNDGDMDVYLSRKGSAPGRLMKNQGNGTFVVDVTYRVEDTSGPTAWGDVDGDGDLDLHVQGQRRHLLRNLTAERAGTMSLRVVVLDGEGRATQAGATVRLRRVDGSGAEVQAAVVDGGSGYLGQNQYAAHFGVAPAERYALEVSFPSRPEARVIVGPAQLSWLGGLVPRDLASRTITVFRDGRAHLGDWIITAAAGAGGWITPDNVVPVDQGGGVNFVISPNPGHAISDVQVDGVSVGPAPAYTFGDVTRDHTITASFATTTVLLTVEETTGGRVTRSLDLPSYPWGSNVQLTAVPDRGYRLEEWSGDVEGTANPVMVMMDGDKVAIANFVVDETPVPFTLESVLPNPSTGPVNVTFGLPAPTHVRLEVMDLMGRSATILVNEDRPGGWHTVTWDAKGRPAGLYFLRLEAGDQRQVRRLILAR